MTLTESDFTLDSFISQAQGLSEDDLVLYCNLETNRAVEALQTKAHQARHVAIRKYRDFVLNSLAFFQEIYQPDEMPDTEFERLKPIVEHLVTIGQWHQNHLNNFT